MKIKNVEGLTDDQIIHELRNGAKFVVFQYCFSVVVATFKRGSDIYFIRPGESTARFSLKFTVSALLFGWWGIPWGPIYTIQSLWKNLRGGVDVTEEMKHVFQVS